MKKTTDNKTASPDLQASIKRNIDTVQLPEEDKTGLRSRAKIVISRFDRETGERRDHLPNDPSPDLTRVADTCHAFTLRKHVNGRVEQHHGEIEITDQHLWNLLKGLLGHTPYHVFQGAPVALPSPYRPLILNWEKLEQATKSMPENNDDKQARSDLKLLLDSISSSSGDARLDRYFKSRDSYKEQKSVTFETLWTIFPPGSLIYGRPFKKRDQLFIVQDCFWDWPREHGDQSPWRLQCWTYDWDGKLFRRIGLRLEFEYFEGYKPITSLPYYPFELHEHCAITTDNLLRQGKRYRDICTATQGSRMSEYDGEVILIKRGFSGIQGDDEVSLSATARSAAHDA